MQNVFIVVDELKHWQPFYPSEAVISFEDYLTLSPILDRPNIRIINLCSTKSYLGQGYYCSLLAEARRHKVLPTVNTINDLRNKHLYLLQLDEIKTYLNEQLPPEKTGQEFILNIYFGETTQAHLQAFARKLFERVAHPILQVTLEWRQAWLIKSLKPLSLTQLDGDEQTAFAEALDRFNRRLWQKPRRNKQLRWDLAILVNPKDPLGPSDPAALKRFVKAGAKVGIDVDFIEAKDYARLAEYDALFIRETTEINHHTYYFARKSEVEGMVVMDDPTSILRCCNKVFLQDAFRYNKIPTPKTRILSSTYFQDIEAIEAELGYPMVLKIPNGSFSRGVSKVENRQELKTQLKALFAKSSLILAQEFLYTEFDWRVGILNGKPLFASRYYMVKDHWQIYSHSDTRAAVAGKFDTLPTYEVPREVLEVAIKASHLIGDGLYGIDIKQQGKKAYVIEVNDNPSIDHQVEDIFLGDELYMQIMSEFARRLESRGRS